MRKPRGIQAFLLTSLWTTCGERLQNWKWGERSEVKELIFLHNMTLSQWQLNSHDLPLCSHKDKSAKDTEECFSKENSRLRSQQFLWKVPLPVSYKILYLKCQIKQSVLKGKLPKHHRPWFPLDSWSTDKIMKIAWPPRALMLKSQVKESSSN